MIRWLAILALLFLPAAAGAAFDQDHRAWTELLRRHVVLTDEGRASKVRYAAFARDRAALGAYLGTLSRVTPQEFAAWTREQRLAFLINAYNAFTIELILTRYPDLKSIRDLGNIVFNSPWKKKFFTLLGKEQSLDGIEHDVIRAPGAFEEPRIHFAVNCASIGCPMLREEAYVAARLDAQLEEQAERFLSDRSRNRYDPRGGRLEVSMIFDWYGKDFSRGWKGYGSVEQFFAKYAARLADGPEAQNMVRDQKAGVKFLDYDWTLNDLRP